MSRLWLLPAALWLGAGVAAFWAAFSGAEEDWTPLAVGVFSGAASLMMIRGGMLLERARRNDGNEE